VHFVGIRRNRREQLLDSLLQTSTISGKEEVNGGQEIDVCEWGAETRQRLDDIQLNLADLLEGRVSILPAIQHRIPDS